MAGMASEKYITKEFCGCANITESSKTNLAGHMELPLYVWSIVHGDIILWPLIMLEKNVNEHCMRSEYYVKFKF